MGDHLAIARNPAVAFRQVCAIRSSDHGQKHMKYTAACWLPTKAMPMLALGIPSRGFRDSFTGLVEVQYIGNSKGRKENPTVVR